MGLAVGRWSSRPRCCRSPRRSSRQCRTTASFSHHASASGHVPDEGVRRSAKRTRNPSDDRVDKHHGGRQLGKSAPVPGRSNGTSPKSEISRRSTHGPVAEGLGSWASRLSLERSAGGKLARSASPPTIIFVAHRLSRSPAIRKWLKNKTGRRLPCCLMRPTSSRGGVGDRFPEHQSRSRICLTPGLNRSSLPFRPEVAAERRKHCLSVTGGQDIL